MSLSDSFLRFAQAPKPVSQKLQDLWHVLERRASGLNSGVWQNCKDNVSMRFFSPCSSAFSMLDTNSSVPSPSLYLVFEL
jgi:hypothetical protein